MICPRQIHFLSAFFNTIMSSRLKCENIGPFRDAGFDFDVKALQYQSDICSANQKPAVSHGSRVQYMIWNEGIRELCMLARCP